MIIFLIILSHLFITETRLDMCKSWCSTRLNFFIYINDFELEFISDVKLFAVSFKCGKSFVLALNYD